MKVKKFNLLNKAKNFYKYYSFFDTRKFLLIEKGRYIIKNRDDVRLDENTVLIENTCEASDAMWSQSGQIDNYLYPQRLEFYDKVLEKLKDFNFKDLSKIIDVGCGIGYFTNLIKRKYTSSLCHAYDFSEKALITVQENYPDLIIKKGPIHNIDYPDDEFDMVISMEVLEHVQFVEKAVAELKRICKKGGYIIITVPNGQKDNYIGHTNFWDKDDFESILHNQNLITQYFFYFDKYPKKDFFMVFIIKKTT